MFIEDEDEGEGSSEELNFFFPSERGNFFSRVFEFELNKFCGSKGFIYGGERRGV